MIISFIGTRGTHPSSGQGTMSFIVDNKVIFDICPEFVLSYTKFIESWNTAITENTTENLQLYQNLYGTPSFAKLEHVFISHLHYDHWGGLRHLLIWSQRFEASFREERPLHVYIPKLNLELFKLRLQELFQVPKEHHMSEEEFFLRYLMVEIDISLAKYVRIHAIEDGQILHIGKYEVQALQNKHFRGSLSYKLLSTKYKLNEEKLQEHGIPKGPLLSKLQRESKIEFNGNFITVEEIFNIKKTILGYSGDTPIDENLLQWLRDCTILIHETTYFEDGEEYHTDSHTSMDELLPKINSFANLKAFLPVHFSERYTWQEIEEQIENIRSTSTELVIEASKLGSILYYDDKSEKTTMITLNLIQKF